MINIDLTKEQGVNIEFTSNIVYGGEGGKTVDVVQSTGSSKNAVMSQDAVTRELEKKTDKSDVYTKTEVDDKLKNVDVDLSDYATKDYVEQEIGKIDIPNTDNLETKSDANAKLAEAKSYTDEKFNSIDIPKLPDLAEVATSGSYKDLKDTPTIPDVSGLATKESLNTKQDKTAIVTATDAVIAGNRSVINVTGDVVISLEPYEQDGYAHSYEIVLNVGDTAYSVAFPESVKWVKDLEIEANTTYSIVIEDNLALYVAIK